MTGADITHFGRPGKQNTDGVLDAVERRIRAGGVSHVVVASNTGATGLKAIERLSGKGIGIVVVTSHAGFRKEGGLDLSPEREAEIVSKGAKVVRASHVLSGVERSFSRKLGGSSRVEAVSEALRSLFGQGMKVCVEITVMAADSGAIPCGDGVEVVSVGGTGRGADTACILRPAHANSFFDMEVREIIAMPRQKKSGKG